MIVKYVLFLILKNEIMKILIFFYVIIFLFLNKSCLYIKLRLIVIVSIKNKSTI